MEAPIPWLQKWKKNQIFEAIQAVGLDPIEFELVDDGTEARITHRSSEARLILGGNAAHYVGSYVAGDAPSWPYDAYSWDGVMQRVNLWLGDLKRDLEMPDLWADLQREAGLLGGASDGVTKNTPFTPSEREEIVNGLQELGEEIKQTYALSEAQVRVLDAKLDYLIDAAGRLGRIDWREVFAGAILSLIITAALPPEAIRHIFLTLLRAIGHFFGLPGLPGG